jgi:hypothetical protein
MMPASTSEWGRPAPGFALAMAPRSRRVAVGSSCRICAAMATAATPRPGCRGGGRVWTQSCGPPAVVAVADDTTGGCARMLVPVLPHGRPAVLPGDPTTAVRQPGLGTVIADFLNGRC